MATEQEIPDVLALPTQPMTPAIALKTLIAVTRSVNGTGEMHDVIRQALHVIRARLIRADELEAQLEQRSPI